MSSYDRWLQKAERFKIIATEMLSHNYYPEACFYSQQSIEMLLKGLIIKFLGARPYTHNLQTLYTMISKALNVEVSNEERECLKKLSNHYSQSRYPDARITEYEYNEAEECVKCLEVLWVKLRKY